jgi:hypothetical protein
MGRILVVFLVISFVPVFPPAPRSLAAGERVSSPDENGHFDVGEVSIAEEFGSIKEIFRGKSGPAVVFIQDSHGNFEVQKNCARIISSITGKFKSDKVLINLEGASGFIDTSAPASMPQRDIRAYVNEYFLSQGQISGAEYFSIVADRPVLVYGAEDRDVYEQNFRSFREAHLLRKDAEQVLSRMSAALTLMKRQFFPPAVVELTDQSDGFDRNIIPLPNYVVFLKKYAQKYRVPLDEFPNMRLVLRVMDQELKIDGNKVDSGRERIIDALQKRLTPASMAKVVRRSLLLRMGEISHYAYYDFLLNAAQTCRLDTSRCRELHAYVNLLKMNARIDKEKLLEEFQRVEMKLKNRLCAAGPAREFDGFYRDFKVLYKLLHLSLSRKEFDYFKKHKERFEPKRFCLFFEENAKGILAAARRPPQQKATLDRMLLALPAFENICASLPLFERFYRLAVKRDRIILDNVMVRMDKEKVPYSILVTGGFHLAGITHELKSRGVSYVVVVPTVTDFKAYNPYLAVMMGEQNVFKKALQTAATGLAVPSMYQDDPPFGKTAQKAFMLKNALFAHLLVVLSGLSSTSFDYDWAGQRESILKGFVADGRLREEDVAREMREFLSLMDLVRIAVSKITAVDGGVCVPFSFRGGHEQFCMAIGGSPLFSRFAGIERGVLNDQPFMILSGREFAAIEGRAETIEFDKEWPRIMGELLGEKTVNESS